VTYMENKIVSRHRKAIAVFACVLLYFSFCLKVKAQDVPNFKMLVMAELGDQHRPYVDAAKIWLNQQAKVKNFSIDYIENPQPVNSAFLKKYQVIFQLNYPPYAWSDTAKTAFEQYIVEGRGGWIGVHHATLLGDFNGYSMWSWFSKFMGDIRFTKYIADFASADVTVEDRSHPCMKNVPSEFLVAKDEWYTYDVSPRVNVRVLASVNESSYKPPSAIKMGDHPVVWSNEHYAARNIYIFMGHDRGLFSSEAYTTLLSNAIDWASKK
jgi:type 1 glutamine amidotransferase